jgi:hypothetical protein
MLSLAAVEPDGCCGVDADGVGQDLVGGNGIRSCRHEAGIERIGHVGLDVLDGNAWVVESGSSDGVVLVRGLVFARAHV